MNLFVEVINCDNCKGIRNLCDHHSNKVLEEANTPFLF